MSPPLLSQEVKVQLENEREKISNLKQRYPSGLRNYETTYKHDYFGTLGENREATMQYPDKRSLTPDFSLKSSPPAAPGAPRTPSPN